MRSIVALLLAASLSGCAFTHIRDGKGASLTRFSLGTSNQVGHVKSSIGGDKPTTLDVGPLVIDQAKTAGKALDAGGKLAPLVVP